MAQVKAPELVPVKQARESLAQGLKVEAIDLPKVEIQYPTDDQKTFFINGHQAGMEHVKYICTRAGLPVATVMQMSPKLRSASFGELLKGHARLLINGKVVHILGEEGVYVPYPKLFDALSDSIKATEVEVTPGRSFYMNFVTAKKTAAKPGDIIRSGISFISEFDGGMQTFALGPFCYRLVCSNGMIGREDATFEIQSAKEDDILEQLRSQAIAFQQIADENLIPHFIKLQKKRVTDPVSWMHGYLGDVAIGSKNHRHLLDAAQSVETPTAWDLVNLVTNFANQVKPSHRRRLQKLGGHMVSAEANDCRCPQCHRDLNKPAKPVISD